MKACKNNGGSPLTEDESSEANRLAADNLKQRYIRDQRGLLNTLEAERERQRAKLVKAMAKKRASMSEREIEKSDEELKQQLDQLDRSYEIQEKGALAAPQKNFLLALSAIHIEDEVTIACVSFDVQQFS